MTSLSCSTLSSSCLMSALDFAIALFERGLRRDLVRDAVLDLGAEVFDDHCEDRDDALGLLLGVVLLLEVRVWRLLLGDLKLGTPGLLLHQGRLDALLNLAELDLVV